MLEECRDKWLGRAGLRTTASKVSILQLLLLLARVGSFCQGFPPNAYQLMILSTYGKTRVRQRLR